MRSDAAGWLRARKSEASYERLDVPFVEDRETPGPHQLSLPFPDRKVPAYRLRRR